MAYLDNLGVTRLWQHVIAKLDEKISKAATVTSAASPLSLRDNTEYRLTGVSELTLNYPLSTFEVWMRVTFAQTGTVSISFPTGTQFIGATPVFANGQTWEISIKDGVAICWRVE